MVIKGDTRSLDYSSCRGYIGRMEKRMETIRIMRIIWGYIWIIGWRMRIYWDNEKKMETIIMGLYRVEGEKGQTCGLKFKIQGFGQV